jgi:hypothetical protein
MLEEESKQLVVPDEPTANDDPNSIVTIQFIMPDNKKYARKFFNHNHVSELINFIRRETGKGANQIRLAKVFPKKILENTSASLKDEGIAKNETLRVEIS